MKQINELASQQDERNTKLVTESQKKTRVNACEVPKEGEQRTKNTGADGSQQILLEIQQMKSEVNDLKGRVNEAGWRNQTGADHPTEAVETITYQSTQVGVTRVVKSMEEERNVTTVLLVVILDT